MNPPEQPSVRHAVPEDVPALVALMQAFYEEASFTIEAADAEHTFVHLLRSPALGEAWVLLDEGEPAGFVVLTVSFSMEHGGLRGFVDDLYVRPASRGRGLASLALAEVKRECGRRGVRALLVETGHDNAVARRVYAAAGFADSGRLLLSQRLEGAGKEA